MEQKLTFPPHVADAFRNAIRAMEEVVAALESANETPAKTPDTGVAAPAQVEDSPAPAPQAPAATPTESANERGDRPQASELSALVARVRVAMQDPEKFPTLRSTVISQRLVAVKSVAEWPDFDAWDAALKQVGV